MNNSELVSRAVRVGAYAVCVSEGAILLARQVAEGPAQGKWTLPGGGVRFGEEPAVAAARECFEETGLTPSVGAVLAVHSNTYLIPGSGIDRHGIRLLFAAEFEWRRPQPRCPDDEEIDEVGWFDLHDLPQPITEWAVLAAQVARS